MTDKAAIVIRRVDFSLTRLICDLMEASMQRRVAADPAAIAAHYGVKPEHADFILREARRANETWPIKGGRHGKR
jgi:hypothetical protein